MRSASLLAVLLVAIGVPLPSVAATAGFDFSVWDDRKGRTLMSTVSYEGLGAWAARRYEKNPEQVNGKDRFNAFSYYMQTMKFVQAERLANDSFGDHKAMRLLLLGMVKLCRGDFDGAVDSLTLAERSGDQTAVELRVPVSCLILHRPEEVRTSVEQMITAGKYDVSAPTAKAVMAYCQVGKDGAAFFNKVTKHLQLEPIYLRKGVLENYVWLCRKYNKLDEIDFLKDLYERRNGPFGKPTGGFTSAQIRETPELEVEVDFQTGKTSTERYFWLRLAQDDSKGAAADAAQNYERNPARLSEEAKLAAFKYYITNLKFVQAERLAESLDASAKQSSRGRGYLALGMARLCRGDYEQAVAAFQSAESSGSRTAAHFRLYLCSLVFLRPAEAQEIAKRMIESREYNTSRLAASAMLAYCHVAKDGEKAFEQIGKQMNRVLLSDDSVLNLYVKLCKRLGKSEELKSLRPYIESSMLRPFSDE